MHAFRANKKDKNASHVTCQHARRPDKTKNGKGVKAAITRNVLRNCPQHTQHERVCAIDDGNRYVNMVVVEHHNAGGAKQQYQHFTAPQPQKTKRSWAYQQLYHNARA